MSTTEQNGSLQNNKITISDLTSKYQQTIDSYNNMINSMSDEQKKIFQVAINLFDIQHRQNYWDSYIGYALKSLLLSGWYYNLANGTWDTCMTPETYVNFDGKKSNEEAYNDYVRTLYPRTTCALLGISMWDILDRDVDVDTLKQAIGGEMEYDEFDLSFNVETFDMGGEQTTQKKSKTTTSITHPDIPISSNIDVAELTKGDSSNDKFIYAYTDSGLSKNKRNWRPMIMDRIAQQVMEQNPPGNMGHINPKNVGYELPLPVVTWIGAVTELLPDGVKRLWLKGYIIPTDDGNNLKTYIRAKAINSISVYGGLTLLPNADDGTTDVLDIDLKSIDISGKLKEGLNSGITELAGEMANPEIKQQTKESEVKNQMGDLRTLTLNDLKVGAPQLFGEMKTEVINQMKIEDEQKIIMTKAGEMDTLITSVGGQSPLKVLSQYNTYAGEMADALSIKVEPNTVPNLADITAKVKGMAQSIETIKTFLKPVDGQTIEEKAEEIAKQNKLAQNVAAINIANEKFNELTKDVNNEAIKNLVAMQYGHILNAKPETLADDYAQVSIKVLEDNVLNTIAEVTKNAQTLMQSGQQAGEMALFDNLGVGNGAGTQSTKTVEQMSDTEYAKSLGYEF